MDNNIEHGTWYVDIAWQITNRFIDLRKPTSIEAINATDARSTRMKRKTENERGEYRQNIDFGDRLICMGFIIIADFFNAQRMVEIWMF